MRPVSLFRQIHLKEGNLELKPKPKTDRLSHVLAEARTDSLTHYVNQIESFASMGEEMANTTSDSCDGALPVETRQAIECRAHCIVCRTQRRRLLY